jgi:hypothetical protein
MVAQHTHSRETTNAKKAEIKAGSDHSYRNNATSELLIEQQQGEPPTSERKRVVEVLYIRNKVGSVTYRNDC